MKKAGQQPEMNSKEGEKIALDLEDKKLLNLLQSSFPLVEHPFRELAQQLDLEEDEVKERVQRLKDEGIIREIGAIFSARKLGYHSALVALRLPPHRLDEGADIISQHPGVSHNYARNHPYNLWFTLTVPPLQDLRKIVTGLAALTEAQEVLFLPALRVFKLGVHFNMLDSSGTPARIRRWEGERGAEKAEALSEEEMRAVRELQKDLPVTDSPFQEIAQRLEITTAVLLQLMQEFLRRGIMRRYGAVLRHRRAGFTANALGCWVVPESRAEEIGKKMASFAAVSHCYKRPSYPEWRYNVFTMIHGHTPGECEAVAEEISGETGVKEHLLLYSTKEYKKQRVRYFEAE